MESYRFKLTLLLSSRRIKMFRPEIQIARTIYTTNGTTDVRARAYP